MKKALFPAIALILVLALALALVGSVGAAGEGSLKILKQDGDGNALKGATFVISPDPQDWDGDLTVVDNGANDADPTNGVLLVLYCIIDPNQEYTVTETVAPPGYDPAPPQTGIKITPIAPEVTLTFINTTIVGGEVHSVNKIGVFAPWIGLAVLLIAGGMVWLRLRRRSA
jgi:hypothetical protein